MAKNTDSILTILKSTKIYFWIALYSMLSSCSFNSIYLQPDKLPAKIKSATLRDGNDSTKVYFSGDNYQPVFVKNGKDTLNNDYSVESVIFKSASGNNLNGWFIKPLHQNANITLLAFHGNAGCLLSQYQFMMPLVMKGFQVFIFDYSGFGFSDGEATRKNVLEDGLSALDFVKSRDEVKNTKLVIYGQSLGGHLSAVVASQKQSLIDGLVIEGAFSSHDDIAASSAGFFGRLLVRELYCGKKSIEQYKKPVLIIHSVDDKTVPFKHGKKLFEHANEPKEFYEINGGHIQGPILYTDSISVKIRRMIQQ
ncbi:MAG TPA: alpha/beta fold hydrolase [Bacteroidia bacterium]|nr:alpha/beta fold hydrolase [Bacteroidia bacterium]